MGEPTGLCECGCGQPAPVAQRSEKGYLKGQPKRFIRGHGARGPNHGGWVEDNPSYTTIHTWLRANHQKTGICEECGERPVRATEFALIKGRLYSRNREDYRELCKPCHNAYDEVGGSRWRGVVTAEMRAGDAPECQCGCGKLVPFNRSKGKWRACIPGHKRPSRRRLYVPAPPRPLIACHRCGKEFRQRHRRAKFCSPACSAAFRRASGMDDVEITCHQCGGTFISNRYNKARHCSYSCAATCQHAGGCPH